MSILGADRCIASMDCRLIDGHSGPCDPRSPLQAAAERAAPALRHRNSAERKAEPIHSGVLLYFPDALAAIARLSKAGNDKHNPGQPLHWARGKSTDHMDCVTRHTLTPHLVDPETGETEQVAAAWRALASLQLAEEARLVKAGIIPYSGICPDASILTDEQRRQLSKD